MNQKQPIRRRISKGYAIMLGAMLAVTAVIIPVSVAHAAETIFRDGTYMATGNHWSSQRPSLIGGRTWVAGSFFEARAQTVRPSGTILYSVTGSQGVAADHYHPRVYTVHATCRWINPYDPPSTPSAHMTCRYRY